MRLLRAGRQRPVRGRVDLSRIQPPASGVSYLLDTYPAFAAYSTRQLSITATNCMRVRRASDNAEADIGFSGGWVDESAIATHCGASNGFVVTWYDQSGNGYNATQTTQVYQHNIYNGTSVYQLNTRPALNATAGGNALLQVTGISLSQPMNMFSVCGNATGLGNEYLSNTPRISFSSTGRFEIASPTFLSTGVITYSGQGLYTALFNGSSSLARRNGSEVISGDAGTTGSTAINIGNDISAGGDAINYIQEYVVYNSDQTANFSAIETDINTAFSVY